MYDTFRTSQRPSRLSMSRFIQKIFCIKSRSRRKPKKCKSFWPPIFFGRDDPNFSRFVSAIYCPMSTVWHRLVEFSLLISVCEASQWSRKQNLRRVSKNAGPIWSRLWTKVHVVLRRYRNALGRLFILCFVPKMQAVKVAVKLWSRKRWFWSPICRGIGCPRFRKCIFKSHSLPNMWPVLVKFCSASSESSWRKKEWKKDGEKERKKKNPW